MSTYYVKSCTRGLDLIRKARSLQVRMRQEEETGKSKARESLEDSGRSGSKGKWA
jgi:hypothetical protein